MKENTQKLLVPAFQREDVLLFTAVFHWKLNVFLGVGLLAGQNKLWEFVMDSFYYCFSCSAGLDYAWVPIFLLSQHTACFPQNVIGKCRIVAHEFHLQKITVAYPH